MKFIDILIIVLWFGGMVALFVAPEFVGLIWAVPAGHGAGTAIARRIIEGS